MKAFSLTCIASLRAIILASGILPPPPAGLVLLLSENSCDEGFPLAAHTREWTNQRALAVITPAYIIMLSKLVKLASGGETRTATTTTLSFCIFKTPGLSYVHRFFCNHGRLCHVSSDWLLMPLLILHETLQPLLLPRHSSRCSSRPWVSRASPGHRPLMWVTSRPRMLGWHHPHDVLEYVLGCCNYHVLQGLGSVVDFHVIKCS